MHFGRQFGLDKRMKSVRTLQWVLVAVALAMSGLPVMGDDINLGRPLIQVTFDQLIPIYPTITPKFSQLVPTTLPLIQTGIARVPITENLVYPLSQPLLLVNERAQSYATALSRRPRPRASARAVSAAW